MVSFIITKSPLQNRSVKWISDDQIKHWKIGCRGLENSRGNLIFFFCLSLLTGYFASLKKRKKTPAFEVVSLP